MQTRVEVYPAPITYPFVADVEIETPILPRDHPPWMRDTIAVSVRARELLARIKPLAVRVLTFWDHTVR
ncbi:MAG: hypothetical protein M3126_12660, partial [Candidatus Eremiobacteraeota bacterium]|nr:hypothetical protein [Candidatus Eremiobacteraeota bacterium]